MNLSDQIGLGVTSKMSNRTYMMGTDTHTHPHTRGSEGLRVRTIMILLIPIIVAKSQAFLGQGSCGAFTSIDSVNTHHALSYFKTDRTFRELK